MESFQITLDRRQDEIADSLSTMGAYHSKRGEFSWANDGMHANRRQICAFVASFGPEYEPYAAKMTIDYEGLHAFEHIDDVSKYLDDLGVTNFDHKYTLVREWDDWKQSHSLRYVPFSGGDRILHNTGEIFTYKREMRERGIKVWPTPYEVRIQRAKSLHEYRYGTVVENELNNTATSTPSRPGPVTRSQDELNYTIHYFY